MGKGREMRGKMQKKGRNREGERREGEGKRRGKSDRVTNRRKVNYEEEE